MSDCLFCKLIDRQIPANIAYEDDEVLAFHDINPQAPTHLLIIPKKHVTTVNDFAETDAALIGRMTLTAQKLAKELGFAEDGYRLNVNTNKDGGQTVYHVHMHLLAGRQFHWPPG